MRRAAVPAALLVLALAGAACGSSPTESADGIATAGGSSNDNEKASAKKGTTDPQQAALDFAECMREHGVDMPDPQAGGGGLMVVGPTASSGGGNGTVSAAPAPPDGFEAAHEACRHFLEDLIQDGGAQMDPEAQDRALRFARCMREHGVDMPDPDFSGGGVRIQIGRDGSGLDPTSETFKKAQEACGTAFGPGGGPGGPASSGVRIGGGRS